ncbi:hypothetical protein H0H87_008335 [Tephrocybe sp. NHM501043]|nr:hypothetical protein H0H87_008335 [Tephrocybe sp. NHM501043]
MSALNASDPPAQDAPAAIDTQQLTQPPDGPRKPKTPSGRRACVACHTGKTRCSEHLPCQVTPPSPCCPVPPTHPRQSCIKRGLAQSCAYPDPDADHAHHTPGIPPHSAHLHDFAITPAPADPAAPPTAPPAQSHFVAVPPAYSGTLAQQQYYTDYNYAAASASSSSFSARPAKRPRTLTEEETQAITRNYTRGEFFIGNNAPVRIDVRLPVRLTLGDQDQVHFMIGESQPTM